MCFRCFSLLDGLLYKVNRYGNTHDEQAACQNGGKIQSTRKLRKCDGQKSGDRGYTRKNDGTAFLFAVGQGGYKGCRAGDEEQNKGDYLAEEITQIKPPQVAYMSVDTG